MAGPDKSFEKALLAWVVEQGTNATGDAASDYSKGFSGTKQDTIMEKAYGEVLRGTTEGEKLDNKNPFPRQPCGCSMMGDGSHGRDCPGKWLRTLNKHRTCYLYVHTITHEITGLRPGNFVDGDEEQRKRAAAALGDLPDFLSCQPAEALACSRRLYSRDARIPLLLLGAEDGMRETALQELQQQGAVIFDTRPWVLPVAKTKIKFADHVGTWTKTVKMAMKKGTPLMLDATEDCPQFLDKLCKHAKYSKAFPEQVFNPAAKGWMKDLLFGNSPADGFVIGLVTNMTPQSFESELNGKVALQHCAALRVRAFVPARIIDVKDLKAEDKGGAFREANSMGKTLLLLDSTTDRIVDTFLMYQRCVAVDMMQLMESRRTTEEIREVLRSKMVTAMKAGDKFLLRLKEGSPDFSGTLCADSDVFPAEVFGGLDVLSEKGLLERIFREEEKEHGVTVCREGFQVVISSEATLENFSTALGGVLPLNQCLVHLVEDRE
mmetsp:Transcript_5484/g.14034  ORF Transcript_5484/g.14034 Transcript_5484/m.14034 type:complete len:492 (-) Transcript_5484:229-1704(-)